MNFSKLLYNVDENRDGRYFSSLLQLNFFTRHNIFFIYDMFRYPQN